MVSFAKIGSSDAAKTIVETAGNLIKNKDKIKLKDAEKLLTKEKNSKKVKVGDKEVNVSESGSTTEVSISKKDIKVKKPEEISDVEAKDILLKYNAQKLTPKILSDFNVKNMKSEKDILKFIELISKKYSGDIKNRTRGIQDHSQTKKLADVIGKDPKHLTQTLLRLKPGDTLNAEYMLAARELLAAGMARLDEIAQLVTKDGGVNATDAMKLEFRQHFALMSEFQKIVKGVQTETARTLQSMRIPTQGKQFTNVNIDDLNKSDLLIQMGGSDEVTKLATLYIRSGNAGSHSRLKFNTDTGGFLNLKKVSDSIGEIFINSILSAPSTHVRNTVGNWVAQGVIATERKIAARLYGSVEGSGIAAYEDIAAAYGQSMAAQEMWMALSQTFKQEGGMLKMLKNFDKLVPATHAGSKVEMHGNKLTASNFNIENKVAAKGVDLLGQILTLNRIPTKMLSSSDNIFKNREYRAQLFKLAYRDGMEQYHKGTLKYEDISAYIAHRVDSPKVEVVEAAKKEMLYSVFQTKAGDRGDILGSLAKVAQDIKGSGGGYMTWLTNYYIPFTQTPINIAGFVAERTPLMAQILTNYNKKIAAGGAEATMAKVKLQLGSMFYMAAIGSTYAMSGDGQRPEPLLMSGADIDIKGKTTGGKYEMMQGFGFEPNSIRIPNGQGGFHQVNLTGNDPISSMFAMAGNSAKAIEMMMFDTGIDHFFESDSNFHEKFGDVANKKINTLEMAQITMAMALSFGENLTNSTYLQGAGNLFEDIQMLNRTFSGDDATSVSSKKAAKRWSMKFATGFFPNVIKKAAKYTVNDDYQKISNEWGTLIQSQLYNKNLPDKYTIFGDKKKTFGFYKNVQLSDVQKEVYRVMPKLSRTSNTLTMKGNINLEMTAEEQSFFQFHSGDIFNTAMTELIKDVSYQRLDVAVQKIKIKDVLTASRKVAKDMIKSDGSGDIPASKFYESINSRHAELFLNKMKMENDGDPFKDESLIELDNKINNQEQIIEANTQ